MLVSIISTVYNGEKYLDEYFESVIAQSYTEWELLIVNDGSEDGSLQIVQKWADSDERIHCITQENQGLSQARNVALDQCHGEYLVFVDCDDYLHRDYLKNMVEAIREEKADMVICNFARVYDKEVVPDNRMPEKREKWDSRELLKRGYTFPACYTVVWNRLYTRKMFQNIRFTKGILNEDSEIMLRLFEQKYTIVYIPERLYYYRRTGGGITGQLSEKLVLSSRAWIVSHVKEYEKRNDLELLYAAAKMLIYNDAERFSAFPSNMRKEIRDEIHFYGKKLLCANHIRLKAKVRIFVMMLFPMRYSKWYLNKVGNNK